MKKRITLILILMSVCVTGITGLQLYWNYQNYKSTVSNFKHDANAALNTAVDKEIDTRHEKIIRVFKKWMADTSFITITCRIENRDSATVFNVKDTHPYAFYKKNPGFYLGLSAFKEKLNHITPKAKTILIDHIADYILKEHLKKGEVYFYTPRLGDSVTKAVNNSFVDVTLLKKLYQQELAAKDIYTGFTLARMKTNKADLFFTQQVNTSLRRPYVKEFVFAAFENPDVYFLKTMKWLLVSSFLLIGITIFCYAYTVKTLLSQQKLAELKNDFVNNMTHELKTPIATINIAAEAIQDFNLSKASADEYLAIIRNQAGNLGNLVEQILKNVISEQENVSLNIAAVNLAQLIKSIITDYKPQSVAAGITINYTVNGEDLATMADESLLRNAIVNLVDNAIKYGGNGAIININQSIENGHVLISVADNGPGIPQQYKDKVFDRFFRVPSGNIHNVKGYGLGLSYAKSIVGRHNGTLTLTSAPGGGTKFIINLPGIYHEASKGTAVRG
jgi:signal transduction histidine kinase